MRQGHAFCQGLLLRKGDFSGRLVPDARRYVQASALKSTHSFHGGSSVLQAAFLGKDDNISGHDLRKLRCRSSWLMTELERISS